ncbi:unnamed protein product [Sphenostylis stenocarpa]|uniref:Uncharacterized protein n=1 Tax=Sphenostylis stenocarpa TaxID=92480 RepID=A0AA87B7U1_9FABA|nr:unnamed protein product [Sphenostylis stenocarpa]
MRANLIHGGLSHIKIRLVVSNCGNAKSHGDKPRLFDDVVGLFRVKLSLLLPLLEPRVSFGFRSWSVNESDGFDGDGACYCNEQSINAIAVILE